MKVFLDFGGNKAQGLKKFISMYNMDESWIIETFEPDPNCEIEKYLPDMKNIVVNNGAIWTHDGEVDFSQMLENTEGSSVECLMNDGTCADPNSESFRKHDSIIKVKCFDISNILRKYSEAEIVVVKMDVEGSEYAIIRKILSDDTISFIDHLYVEWHHSSVVGEDINTTNHLRNSIRNRGIQINEWY
jgi:FkbM family methyltransferase